MKSTDPKYSLVPLQVSSVVNGEEILGTLIYVSQLANDYAKSSRSKSTVKSYSSDWSDFEFWCTSKRLCSMPADPYTVTCYLADRATNPFISIHGKQQSPLKVSSLARRLSAISQTHQRVGLVFDRKHSAVQETWKGIKNTCGISQKRKAPILIQDLRLMIKSIPIEKNEKPNILGIRDRALLLLGFAGAFRRSELVNLEIDDLKLVRDGYVVTLRRSKTDQQGEGREIAIPYGANPETCPVRTLLDWLNISGLKSGPLFRSINRHGHLGSQALTSHAVALIVKRNPHLKERFPEFSGHSLRAGFATTAAIAGVPEFSIMKQTGHKRSDTLKKYIRSRDLWSENPAVKVGL